MLHSTSIHVQVTKEIISKANIMSSNDKNDYRHWNQKLYQEFLILSFHVLSQ